MTSASPRRARSRPATARSASGWPTVRRCTSGALLEFLALRAIPSVEIVTDDHYTRAIRLPHGVATVMLTPMPDHVAATLQLADVRDLAPAVARCRRLLDLDADPAAIDGTLGDDPALLAHVLAEPGVRVPRAVDGFEIAVRAIVGQQISVPAAITVIDRIVRAGAAEEARREAAFHEASGESDAFRESDASNESEAAWRCTGPRSCRSSTHGHRDSQA